MNALTKHRIGDHEHTLIDTKQPGYEPCLTLAKAPGGKLKITFVTEMQIPIEMLRTEGGANLPITVTDFLMERIDIDLRLDGAAEIKAWLEENPSDG